MGLLQEELVTMGSGQVLECGVQEPAPVEEYPKANQFGDPVLACCLEVLALLPHHCQLRK